MGMQYPTDLHSLGQYLQEGSPTLIETFFNIEHNTVNESYSLNQILKVPGFPATQHANLQKLCGRSLEELNQTAFTAAFHAHSERGVPCMELTVPKLDLYHIGGIFAFFETACAISAMLLDVHPFNQPGVEAYKQKMFTLLG